jgi:hypothetical protein
MTEAEFRDAPAAMGIQMPGVSGAYEIRMGRSMVIGWVSGIWNGSLAIYEFVNGNYVFASILVGFLALSAWIVLRSGRYIFDQQGVTHRCALGTFRMCWEDVRRIGSNSKGATLLFGDDSQFPIYSTRYWTGSQKADALALLRDKIETSGIVPFRVWNAAWRSHRNARMSQGS